MCSFWIPGATSAPALVFASPDSEPEEVEPADFPYWENITQRRYEGPSVIYLGAGWAMTARHVGVGEIFLEGEVYAPDFRSRHSLLNANGKPADAIVFQLKPDADLPNLPILPLASVPPLPGEEVLLIGFGRGREKVIEWHQDGVIRFGFEWSKRGSKRWGTNRIESNQTNLIQQKMSTDVLTFIFDQPNSGNTTRYEAHAATGDSGGALFVLRDGEWLLAGMMISVSVNAATPANTATYRDTTFVLDISHYRSEIIRWTRPKCFNEEDDDGDRKIDFPLDPGCSARDDPDERDNGTIAGKTGGTWAIALMAAFAVGVVMLLRLRIRNRS